MHRLCDQFFTGARFTSNEHAELAACNQSNVFLQPAHGRAVAQQLALRCSSDARTLRDACLLRSLGQLVHALGRGYCGGGQIAEGLQQGERVGVGEAAGFKRIQRQQAPGCATQLQHATHAVMYMQLCNRLALLGDQAVIRVWQRAVGLEAHGLPCSHQLGKARMFAEAKAPPQRVGHQAINRHGAQPFALQSQQCDGICWQ